jgi:flagellar motility protein MotE (MotC chaperone)
MNRPFSISGKFIIVCLLIVIISGITAASTTGWIDIKGWTENVFSTQVQNKHEQEKTKSLLAENKHLQKHLDQLEKELKNERKMRIALEKEIATVSSESQQLPDINNYRTLGEYYSSMKPAAAAAILEKLELPMVAAILQGMDPEDAGQILAVMEPERAAQLTEVMAETAAWEGNIKENFERR